MRGLRVIIALFVVMLFFVPPAAQANAGESDFSPPPAGRGDYAQKTPQEVELKLVSGSYSNNAFNISLPSGATVTSASVDLEGKYVVGPNQTISCDFASDPGTMYTAYAGGHGKSTPENNKPSSFVGNQFQGADLSRISYSDNSYAYVYYAYSGSNEWGYHHFQFKVPLDMTRKVTVTYEGWGGYPGGYYGIGSIDAYLWNNKSQSWEIVGSGSDSPKSVFNVEFVGRDYIREQGGQHYIDVLAMCPRGTGYGGYWTYNSVNTDYVKVVVEGNALSYPKNPKMFIGSSPSSVWNLQADVFNYLVSVGDVSIMNALQAQAQRTTTQFADIKFRFTSDTAGIIRVSNFMVSYKAPPWCKGIPDTYTINEDTPTPKLINLNDLFLDDIAGRLNFEIIFEQDPKKLDADIDKDGWMGFKTPTKNWWGPQRFKVRATDSDSLTRDSNNFTVTVLPVNDPPVITPLGRQLATQGVPFSYMVRAKDPDADLDPEETIIFSDNTSLFDIDPSSGKISFTPTQEQVGNYSIGILATDIAGDLDQENFTLEVQDAEDPPVLDEIPDQSAMQDTPFTYTVTATDPDLPYGDFLRFSDNSPLFAIEASTGTISFTPTVKDIGSHKVTVTVNDARDGTDSKQFTLNVLNSMGTMNRPPSVEAIADMTANEGVLFEYTVKGSDPDIDIGDSISYQDNCPVFEIAGGSGRISFKPTAKDAGVYTVKITVKDREGLSAATEFKLTVIKTNHAPNVTEVLPRDGTRVIVDRQFKLSATASDVDGDRLNYTWKDGDSILGWGPNITISFPQPGTYIVTLIVTDGKLEKVNETTIEVVEKTSGKPSSSTPGFESALAMAAAAIAALGLFSRKRR